MNENFCYQHRFKASSKLNEKVGDFINYFSLDYKNKKLYLKIYDVHHITENWIDEILFDYKSEKLTFNILDGYGNSIKNIIVTFNDVDEHKISFNYKNLTSAVHELTLNCKTIEKELFL